MKKIIMIIAAGLILMPVANANANETTLLQWSSGPIYLEDAKYYAWDIYYHLGPQEVITGAVLKYDNLYDYDYSTQDRLFTHLMDDRVGNDGDFVTAGPDTDAHDGYLQIRRLRHWSWKWEWVPPVPASDAWAGHGPLVGVHVPNPWVAETFSYDLADLIMPDGQHISLISELNTFVANGGWISFGIDPDCRFTIPKIVFEITTTTATTNVIPAPGAVLLAGIGVCLVGWLRRRRTL